MALTSGTKLGPYETQARLFDEAKFTQPQCREVQSVDME
jgi:hypothetical protein